MRFLSFNIVKGLVLTFLMWIQATDVINAQGYAVGSVDLTLTDSSRGNRQIDVSVYYPADQAGTSVPVAMPVSKKFPLIVFGHGFLIPVTSYQYIWDHLVPRGFIVALPKTESGTSPSHEAFARDMSFIRQEFARLNGTSGSLFSQRYNGRSCVMGHSMGGGAATLAASYDPAFTSLVTLAAAETNPSAITAASGVTVPSLVISGGEDCVTPLATNQVPMYNAMVSSCKSWVNILDASHCHFAQNNGTCTLGELFCLGLPASYQNTASLTNSLLSSWLRYYLKANMAILPNFENKLIQAGTQIAYQYDCGLFSRPAVEESVMDPEVTVFPNPALQGQQIGVSMAGMEDQTLNISVSEITGKVLFVRNDLQIRGSEEVVSLPLHFAPGCYLLSLQSADQRVSFRFFVR